MGRQQLLLSIVKPPIPLNMKEWRLSWEHKFFLSALIASQVIGVISAFDCRRYVFAPICRGVTSKRATISPLVGNNHAIYDLILRQIKKQQEENTKSEAIELLQQVIKDNSEEDKENNKDIEIDIKTLNENGLKKRNSWNLNDLGGFSSFYKKRYYKKSSPSIDDLDTFSSFINKKKKNNAAADDLGLFTTFYKRSEKDALQQQRDNAMNALGSFTTFYKRNPFDQDQGSRFRRQALEDLGAFTTFMKKDPKFSSSNNKRSTRSISREDLRDALDANQ